jgi:hypothetical protein
MGGLTMSELLSVLSLELLLFVYLIWGFRTPPRNGGSSSPRCRLPRTPMDTGAVSV